MQLHQLLYFVTVAERGSMNKAAEKLFITQPNLSKAIHNLEQELKITIFIRNNKGVSLTEDGKKLYQYARTVLDQMELITNISDTEAPHNLSIASYPILTMARLMGEFYNQSGNRNLSLSLREHRLQKVIEAVETGGAELGFIMNNSVQTKELRHTLKYKHLEYNFLDRDTWYINAGPANPFYDRAEVSMEELLALPFVRMPDDYFSNLTYYLEIDGVKLTAFKHVIYANDSGAILSILRATEAFRFGPGLSAPDFAAYGIRTIPIRNCQVDIQVGWIRRKKEMLSPEAQEFVRLLEGLYA